MGDSDKPFLHLREARLSKGLSVPALVSLTGIPRRTIQDIEKRGDCLASNAKIIADALNITVDDLFSPPQNKKD